MRATAYCDHHPRTSSVLAWSRLATMLALLIRAALRGSNVPDEGRRCSVPETVSSSISVDRCMTALRLIDLALCRLRSSGRLLMLGSLTYDLCLPPADLHDDGGHTAECTSTIDVLGHVQRSPSIETRCSAHPDTQLVMPLPMCCLALIGCAISMAL